jgi:DNA-binding transcriptional LysR family regulator
VIYSRYERRIMKPLDLDTVQAFVLVADLGSFTRAGEASGATQSAVSLKLKRLEAQLDRRLVERTPRSVRLTAEGTAFLDPARDLLAANQRALAQTNEPTPHLSLGVSDHAAGPELPALLARVNGFDPGLAIAVSIGYSRSLLEDYDHERLDAVIARKEGSRRGGEMLAEDEFGWFAAPSFRHRGGERLRLAMLTPPCGVRALAIRALDAAAIAWTETFSGGGVTAVAAAVVSGIAIAPLARRIAPPGSIDIGPALELPRLGRSKVMLYSRVNDARQRAALRTLAAAFRTHAAA